LLHDPICLTVSDAEKVVTKKRKILKDISLSFFPDAKIGVLWLSGSGKSTLLKIMTGNDIEIIGEARPMPDIKIGYLAQEPLLDPAKKMCEEMLKTMSAKPWTHLLVSGLDAVYAAYADEDAAFNKLTNNRKSTKASYSPGMPM